MTTFMMDPWEFLVPVNRYTISSYVHYVSSILKITLNHKINIDTHIYPDMPKFEISIPTIFLICSSLILPSISDLTCALMLEASPCTLNCIDLMVNFSLSESGVSKSRYFVISISIKYSNFSRFYKKKGPFYKKFRCDKFCN